MSKEIHKWKQEWAEAMLASNLTPACKVYVYGLFKHMYGDKTEAWPGRNALVAATGLNDSAFARYNRELRDGKWMEITSRKGMSNRYRLLEVPSGAVPVPTDEVSRSDTEGVDVPTSRGPHTFQEGPNTPSNTLSKTTSSNPTTKTESVRGQDFVESPIDTRSESIEDYLSFQPGSAGAGGNPEGMNDVIPCITAPGGVGGESAKDEIPAQRVTPTRGNQREFAPCGCEIKHRRTWHRVQCPQKPKPRPRVVQPIVEREASAEWDTSTPQLAMASGGADERTSHGTTDWTAEW